MNGPRRRGERIPDPDGPAIPNPLIRLRSHGHDGIILEEGPQLSRRQGGLLGSTGDVSGTGKELRFALFFTQRSWRWGGKPTEGPEVDLMREIVRELRRREDEKSRS
jgi:hypothetical protein